MIRQDDYGFLSNPKNGLGIVRARTVLGNLRLWDIPRSEQAIDKVVDDIGKSPIPCLYMLFDERSEKKVYVGETENLKSRLSTHTNTPEEKIKHWQRAIIINDGRNNTQSDLNDGNIRLVLENYLVQLFKINKYKVVTISSRNPSLSSMQSLLCETFKEEINILLSTKSKISKVITEKIDDEVYIDEVKKTLEKKKYKIQEWGKIEAIINGERVFIRTGSEKPNGWQVTFRGAKSNSFKSFLEKGEGRLLMNRGKILFIPLKEIREFVNCIDADAFLRDTIDIFIKFEEDQIFLNYKSNELDITNFTV
jgi:hypothetical protein